MKAAQTIAALPPEGVAISRRLMKGAPDEVVRRIDEEADAFQAAAAVAGGARGVRGVFEQGRSSSLLPSPREAGRVVPSERGRD